MSLHQSRRIILIRVIRLTPAAVRMIHLG